MRTFSRVIYASTELTVFAAYSTITYPQFVVTPENKLQFVYRTAVSGNGAAQLAEYSNDAWSNVGQWSSATGSYTSTTGAVSTARNVRALFPHMGLVAHSHHSYTFTVSPIPRLDVCTRPERGARTTRPSVAAVQA